MGAGRGIASPSLMGSPRYDPARTTELLQAAATSAGRRLREIECPPVVPLTPRRTVCDLVPPGDDPVSPQLT
jgi:hypothetical protein